MARRQRNKQKHTKDINSFLKDGMKRRSMGGITPALLHWVNPTDDAQQCLLHCFLISHSPLQIQHLYVNYYPLLGNCVEQMRINKASACVCFLPQPSHTPRWQAIQHQVRENQDGTVLCYFNSQSMNAREMSCIIQIDEGLTVLA